MYSRFKSNSEFCVEASGQLVIDNPGEQQMVDVFISYRRKDSKETCEKLYRHLAENLPGLDIFMDIEDIEAGNKWRDVLETGVKKCDVLLAVIGLEWLSIENEEGVRRLTERTDYVRQEISKALRNHKGIIPVLIDGTGMPHKNELPNSIVALADYQAFTLSDNLEGDAKKLAIRIRSEIKKKKVADRSRFASKTVGNLGMILLYPFAVIFLIISSLSGRSSRARKIRRFLLIAIIVIGSFWLLYILRNYAVG